MTTSYQQISNKKQRWRWVHKNSLKLSAIEQQSLAIPKAAINTKFLRVYFTWLKIRQQPNAIVLGASWNAILDSDNSTIYLLCAAT